MNELKKIGLEMLDELKSAGGLIERLANQAEPYKEQANSHYKMLKDRLDSINAIIKKAEKILRP